MKKYCCISRDVKLGKNVKLSNFINLYGCSIADNTKIGAFVEVQKGVRIGSNCKISSHTFICEGVVIEDNVFVGHNVTFINDKYPQATCKNGRLKEEKDWECIPTRVENGAAVGSGAIILCGVTIGRRSLVGAGALVTKDVPPYTVVFGVPARKMAKRDAFRLRERIHA